MHEPIAQRLSRFTPDATGLDRDALLFAAGRTSARPNRIWQALAGTFFAAQILTLVVLWPRPLPQPEKPASLPPPLFAAPPRTPSTGEAGELWSIHRQMYESEGNYVPPATPGELLAPPDPPLRAFQGNSTFQEN
jgi:hypothetical protein